MLDPRWARRAAAGVGGGVPLLLAVSLIACGEPSLHSAAVPDIPVYPGAQLVAAVSAGEAVTQGTPTRAWQPPTTQRDPTETYEILNVSESTVLEWYRAKMPRHGWTATTDNTENVVIYRDAKGCYGFVMATQDVNGRDVMLQISQQRPGSVCIPYTPGPPGTE